MQPARVNLASYSWQQLTHPTNDVEEGVLHVGRDARLTRDDYNSRSSSGSGNPEAASTTLVLRSTGRPIWHHGCGRKLSCVGQLSRNPANMDLSPMDSHL